MATASFDKMTIAELKRFAREHDVSLGGSKIKSDIVKKLKNYKPKDEDCGCSMKKPIRDNEAMAEDMLEIEVFSENYYPECFEICGYAKEIYDANRGRAAFTDPKFKEAMDIYSSIFCFEKDLKAGTLEGYTSFEGTKNLLEGSFETTKQLLEDVDAAEREKNEDIAKIHTKNILEFLEKTKENTIKI